MTSQLPHLVRQPTPDHVVLAHGTDYWEVLDGHRHLIGSTEDLSLLVKRWTAWADPAPVGAGLISYQPPSRYSGEHFTVARVDTTTLQGYPLAETHEWRCPSCGATTRARMADHPRCT